MLEAGGSAGDDSCRIGTQAFRLAEVGAGETACVERLFARAFGQTPSDGWYRWKYGILGGQAVGLWNERGELVAHYAGFPRTLLWRGDSLQAIQIGDVMVAPEVRGLLTRRGPMFLVYSRFVAKWVGTGKPFALSYGFPNERHMRLARHLRIYDDFGIVRQLAWSTHAARLPLGWSWSPLAADHRLAPQAESAWEAMRSDFADHVIGVRDSRYVIDRFVRRPELNYRFFRLARRLTGRTVALAILRLEPGHAELIDVIAPRASFRGIAQAATAEAASYGARYLTCWASAAAAAAWHECGARMVDRAAFFAVPRPSTIPQAELAAARWWWMGGDTDFL